MSKLDIPKIAKGEARVVRHQHGDSHYNEVIDEGGFRTAIVLKDHHATLYADAYNVAKETGLSPRELKDRLDECSTLFMDMDETSLEATYNDEPYDAVQFHLTVREEDAQRVRDFLATLNEQGHDQEN